MNEPPPIPSSKRLKPKRFALSFSGKLDAKHPIFHTPLFIVFVCFASGIVLQEYAPLIWPFLVLGCVAIAILLVGIKFTDQIRNALWVTAACIALILSGMLMHGIHLANARQLVDHCPATERWEPVHLRGHVVSIPAFRPDNSPSALGRVAKSGNEDDAWVTAINVQCDHLVATENGEASPIPFEGIVRVMIPGRHREFFPGDAVDCYVSWRRLMEPSNAGEMSMAQRYRQHGIVAQAKTKSAVQVIKRGQPDYWNPNRYLGQFAMAGDAAFHRYVPYGQAELASALVLGLRDQVEWKVSESLLETGTIHMLAISGLHIDMVAGALVVACMLLRISQRTTLIVVVVATITYSFLCGANPPVLRAMIYVTLVALARFAGWPINSYNLLCAAALCLLAFRTDHLWDTGTQLSFLAVAVLIFVARSNATKEVDPLDELIRASDNWWQRTVRWVKETSIRDVKTSAWVWVLTTPIVLGMFHVVSPIAIAMNLVLFIPLFIGLLSGLGVLVFGIVIPPLGWAFGWICAASLAFSEWAIVWASRIPTSHWWLPAPPMGWILCFYVLVSICFVFKLLQTSYRRPIITGLLAYFTLGCIPWAAFLPQPFVNRWIYWQPTSNPERVLVMTFIDVGHGTSVVAQMPNGETWLYDAGRMGDPDRAFYPIANTLWHMNIARIDRVFLSHADADHYNAMVALLKRFHVKQFYTTAHAIASDKPHLQELLADLKLRDIPIQVLKQSDNVNAGDATCTILHPDDRATYGSDNANSLTMMIQFKDRRFLWPGDLEGAGINRLLQTPVLKIDVLMAPHHGSIAQNPKAILGWSKPDAVVISGGARANRPEVLQMFSQNLRSVWLTARDHALRVELDESGDITWKRWSVDDWESIESTSLSDNDEEENDEADPTAF